MLISFNFQKKDWFIVIGIIIYLLEVFPKFEKKYFRAKKFDEICLKILYQILSKIMFYIPYNIFFKNKNHPLEKKYIENINQNKNNFYFSNIFSNIKKHMNLDIKIFKETNLLIFFIFITIADILQIGFFYYDFVYKQQIYKLRIVFVISTLFFYHWLLNFQMYKHHFFTLYSLIIYGLIIIFNDIILLTKYKNEYKKNEIFHLFIDLNQRLLLMIEIIGLKYLIDKKYINKIFIYFIQGIFELFLLIIFIFVMFFINKEFIKPKFEFLVMIINIIFYFSKNFITIVIIEKLNPCFIGLICCFTNIPLYLYYDDLKIDKLKIWAYFFFICGTAIQIFGILIYSENIILNFYGLNKDIKKNILKREKIEKENLDNLDI